MSAHRQLLAALMPSLLALAAWTAPTAARADHEDELQERPKHKPADDSSDEDEPRPTKHTPRKQKHTAEEELDEKQDPDAMRMDRYDDPKIGMTAEVAGSVYLLAKSGGPGPDATGAIGLRVDWAPGRLWAEPSEEFWKLALWGELAYDFTSVSGGTTAVNTSTRIHLINVRALGGYPIKDFLLLYGAVGAGMGIESVTYNVYKAPTGLIGIKSLFDYGGGLRIFLPLNPNVGFTGRAEAMGVLRGLYMQDVLLTLSAGVTF